MDRGFGLDWILSTQSISYSDTNETNGTNLNVPSARAGEVWKSNGLIDLLNA